MKPLLDSIRMLAVQRLFGIIISLLPKNATGDYYLKGLYLLMLTDPELDRKRTQS